LTEPHAIILAAGSANRLRPLTNERPKCALHVGGRAIIEHQVAALRAAEVKSITVVTGFCADRIRERLGDAVGYLHNADFSTTNSIYSLWLGREHLREGGLILNGDVVFHPDALDALLACEHGNCLLYDPGVGADDPEAMKLALDSDGMVERLSKALPRDRCAGENLGMIRVDAAGAPELLAALDRLIASDVRHAWVPEAINEMRPHQRVFAVANRWPWIEIDTPEDLARADAEIWPQMAPTFEALNR
jgi:choline kinase